MTDLFSTKMVRDYVLMTKFEDVHTFSPLNILVYIWLLDYILIAKFVDILVLE